MPCCFAGFPALGLPLYSGPVMIRLTVPVPGKQDMAQLEFYPVLLWTECLCSPKLPMSKA